jgi:glycerol transport system substrate-binding protein
MTSSKMWFVCVAMVALTPACKRKPEQGENKAPETTSAALAVDEGALTKAAERWVDSEFQPSTLTREQQLEEMKWFREAASHSAGRR